MLLVPLCHSLYHGFDGWAANWCQWVAEHGAAVVLCLLLGEAASAWPEPWRGAGLVALAWLAVEALQCEVCGSLRWGEALPGAGRLCVDRYGTDPYILLASASAAYLIVRGLGWRSRTRRR